MPMSFKALLMKPFFKIEKDLGSYPVFVKPANAGSSVGVSKAENREELRAAIAKAAKEDGKILIEENIVGQEVECAVLATRMTCSPRP